MENKQQRDVWVFCNGPRVIFRGSLEGCSDAWLGAAGSDYWHGSIRYESGPLTYDQQADKLLGVVDFMEQPETGWREPPDFEPMREQMRKLGAASAARMDALIIEAFEKGQS